MLSYPQISEGGIRKDCKILKEEITAMLFAKRYQEHSISIYEACEEYYSQVSFAMVFGNGVRRGIHLR